MCSLLEQMLPPKKVIVVDDGSTDGTSEILLNIQKKSPSRIKIITTHSKTTDYSRLVKLWNMCLQTKYDYHMIAAGDVVFEKDYANVIIKEMDKNPEVVVASGNHQHEKVVEPHGAGRFVKQSFFFKFYNKYPEIIGYESEILFKALICGYKTMVIDKAKFNHIDQVGHKHNFTEFGMGMKALGYHPLYVLARTAYTARLNMLWSYLTFRPKKSGYYSLFPIEFRREVRNLQIQKMKLKIKQIFGATRE